MRLALGLGMVVVSMAMLMSVVSAQSRPEFRLGFKALADRIPEVAGEPQENEHRGANGEALQVTTRGLMVWRKADNWTAFTDGADTWINGPTGVQARPNSLRFCWESDADQSECTESTPSILVRIAPPRAHVTTIKPIAPTNTLVPPSPTGARQASAPRFYTPDVKAMDETAGGHGVTIKQLMSEIDAEWAHVWGWRPTRPTTVYLFTDGYRSVEGIPAIIGRALTQDERQRYMTQMAGFAASDVQTRGYAVVINLSNGMGQPYWADLMKGTIVHEYAHIMQVNVGRYMAPLWYVEGMAEVCQFAKVPGSPALSNRMKWVHDASKKGTLPTVKRLQLDWPGYIASSPGAGPTAYGVAYVAVQLLADKVGGAPLLEVLKRTATGESFETVLQSVTGYTVDRLDSEVLAKLN